jgi:SHS family lactate transporter-like MFS transporter
MSGGTLVGYGSQIFGRRFSIIFISIIGGALLYPYCFVTNEKIIAAAFFEQFCVQGAWGVIPIHLMELSPGRSVKLAKAAHTHVLTLSIVFAHLSSEHRIN